MKIAQIVESLAIGGLEKMAVDLAIALKSRGHESFIYSVCTDGPLRRVAEENGVPVRLFHKAPGFSLQTMIRILRQASADRIQIAHTHNTVIHHYGAVVRLIGISVVNTEHGMGAVNLPVRRMRLFRASIPLTDAVAFVSDDARRLLWDAGNFPRAKAETIRNGIPIRAMAINRATPGANRPRIRFGTVGRLVPVKDHATLLRAFASVLRELPCAELQIVGYGPLEQDIRGLAADLGLGESFKLLPGDTDVPSFLSGLDVFVISSETEGLPISVLEAMAARLPLVSTRVGGIPEAAPEGEVAWYSQAGNCMALADAMRAAAAAADLRQMGERAAAIVQERFSIDTMVGEYENLYWKVLGGVATESKPLERTTSP